MVFAHWPVAPASVRGLFPDGTRPDTFDGQTYVGIVGFAIPSTRLGGVLAIGSTYELNVRLYSIDSQRRQGVVFLSMDVTRPDMVLVARALPRLPYLWSHVESVRPNTAVAGFRLRRHIPSRAGCANRDRCGIARGPSLGSRGLSHRAVGTAHTNRFGHDLDSDRPPALSAAPRRPAPRRPCVADCGRSPRPYRGTGRRVVVTWA